MSDSDDSDVQSHKSSDNEITTEVEIHNEEIDPNEAGPSHRGTKEKKSERQIDYDFPISSTENMMKIKPTDQIVDIVGFITYILKATYTAQGSFVLEFLLSNEENVTVKCVCWGDTARNLSQTIQKYQIIHINGAQAKLTNEQYNLGMLPLHLLIQREKDVTIKELYPYNSNRIKKLSLTSPDLCQHVKQTIYLTAYLKTPFKILSSTLQRVDASIACIGDHLKLLGILNSYGDGSFFISSIENISLEDNKKYSTRALLQCTNNLIFPSTSNSTIASTSSSSNQDTHESPLKKRKFN